MRGEVLGAERRRRWTAEQKAWIVAESFGLGESVSWVARRHDLSTSQLFAWRKAVKEGTDAGRAAVVAAFLPVEVAADDEDGASAAGVRSVYTPPVLPPLASPPDPAGSVVPFRRADDEDGLGGPARRKRPAKPSGLSGDGEGAAGRIEAALPDGVVLRLPGDVAPDRLAELVGALRAPRP